MSLADEINPDESLWSWLAFEVRRWRTAAGHSQPFMGKVMGCPRQTVNNIESGQRPPTEEQCSAMDEFYQSGGFFRRLLMFARLAHDRDWFKQYTEFEARALLLRVYEGQLTPGLFQTPDYARACLVAGRVRDPDRLLEKRMKRQVVLSKTDAPDVQVLLDQAVLHRRVGGPAVMKAQLARLLELGERPNVTVRVVP